MAQHRIPCSIYECGHVAIRFLYACSFSLITSTIIAIFVIRIITNTTMAMIIITLTMKSLNEEVIRGVICRPLNAPNTQNTISSINNDDAYPLDANNDYDDDDSPGDIEDIRMTTTTTMMMITIDMPHTISKQAIFPLRNIARILQICFLAASWSCIKLKIFKLLNALANWKTEKLLCINFPCWLILLLSLQLPFAIFFKSCDRSKFSAGKAKLLTSPLNVETIGNSDSEAFRIWLVKSIYFVKGEREKEIRIGNE